MPAAAAASFRCICIGRREKRPLLSLLLLPSRSNVNYRSLPSSFPSLRSTHVRCLINRRGRKGGGRGGERRVPLLRAVQEVADKNAEEEEEGPLLSSSLLEWFHPPMERRERETSRGKKKREDGKVCSLNQNIRRRWRIRRRGKDLYVCEREKADRPSPPPPFLLPPLFLYFEKWKMLLPPSLPPSQPPSNHSPSLSPSLLLKMYSDTVTAFSLSSSRSSFPPFPLSFFLLGKVCVLSHGLSFVSPLSLSLGPRRIVSPPVLLLFFFFPPLSPKYHPNQDIAISFELGDSD